MRWLPSRHHFALARLIAFLIVETSRPSVDPEVERVVFAIDRHQSTVENYAISIWFVITMTCYIAVLLPLATPAAIVVAFVLVMTGIQIIIPTAGLLVRSSRANSFSLMLCGVAASLYFASQMTWARFAAYFFLGVVALNAIAFMIMWLLRHRVRAAEQRCVA